MIIYGLWLMAYGLWLMAYGLWLDSSVYVFNYHFGQRLIYEQSQWSHNDQKVDSYTVYFFWL